MSHLAAFAAKSLGTSARRFSPVALFSALLLTLGLAGCGVAPVSAPATHSYTISGNVHGGQQPVSAAQILLYKVGTSNDGSTASNILNTTVTTSDGTGTLDANANAGNQNNALSAGAFTLTGDFSCSSNEYVYLVALGGNPGLGGSVNNTAISMMASLGLCTGLTPTTSIFVDEVTTVGSLAALYPYMSSYSTLGYHAGVDDSVFATATSEVNIYTNTQQGSVPGIVPSGYYASQLEIATLGNALAPCLNSSGPTSSACQALFAATTAGASVPTDTIGATLNILNNPTNKVCTIFGLPNAAAPFQPALGTCPTTPPGWVLPIEPIAATPVISPASGPYVGTIPVQITDTTSGATIYYTTDGTNPTLSSTSCTAPCALNQTAGGTINAYAAATGYEYSGWTPSGIASATYTVTPAGAATHLAFTVQPTNTAVNDGMTPVVSVAVEDSNNNIVSSGTASMAPIMLALTPTPGALTSGGGPVNAMNGISTFGVSVNAVANGYTLTATSPGLTPAVSNLFNITNPPLSFQLIAGSNNLVGLGSTLTGYIYLDKVTSVAVPITLSTSLPGDVSLVSTAISVAAGSLAAPFQYTGVAPGASTLTATATGYLTATQQVTATNAVVSLGTLPQVAPGQTTQIALSLGTPAPANESGIPTDVTIVSSNTGAATVTTNNYIYPGLQVPTENPVITGVSFGATMLTATAPNYAPDQRNVTVTLTASMPASESIPLNATTNVVMTLSAPAPSGGLSFALVSSNTAIATVPTNVTVPAGSETVNVPITGVAYGGPATVTATFTSGAVQVVATTAVTVAGSFNSNAITTGNQLYVSDSVSLTVAPTAPVTVKITSSNPAVALLTSNSAAVGTNEVDFTNINSTTIPTFYIQGQSQGTSTLQMSANGYVTSQVKITVNAAGFILVTGNSGSLPITTTTQSGTSNIIVVPAILSTTLTVQTSCFFFSPCALNPGVNVNVTLNNSNPAVGTTPASTTPINFPPQSYQETTTFQPLTAGTTTISIGAQPAGFTMSSDTTQTQGTATVTTPTMSVSSATTGQLMYVSGGTVGLQAPPKSPVTVQLSVPVNSGVLLSSSSSTVGAAVLNFTNITSQGTPTFYVQGQNIGQGNTSVAVTLTVTAPGYTTTSSTITVLPSGFVMTGQNLQSGLQTTTFSSPTSVTVSAAILNAPSLTVNTVCGFFGVCGINPGIGPFNVPITIPSGGAGVGSISASPAVFTGGSNSDQSVNFVPVGAGMTTINLLAQPTGFYATTSVFDPNNYYATNGLTANATVTAPQINSFGTLTGTNLQQGVSPSLPVGPPSPVMVTITSDNPAVALISTSNTVLGTTTTGPPAVSQIQFTNINSTSIPAIYVQGISVGTAHLTVSAPGYTSGVGTITVDPSGFVLDGAGAVINTTTFSTPSTIYVTPAILDPSSLNVTNLCINSGCTISPYTTATCTQSVAACPPMGPFSIALTSSNTGVGNITTSPLTFPVASNLEQTSFQPLTAGTTSLTLGAQPYGFTQTATTTYLTATANVTAPQISVNGGYTGVNMYMGPGGPNLGATPPSPVTVTITSSNPAAVLMSTSPTAVGTSQIILTNVSTAQLPTIYYQGQSLGTAASTSSTITVSAPGYSTGSANITVYPSGFIYYNGPPNISTTPYSSTSTLYVTTTLLTPGTLAVYSNYYGLGISPGAGPVSVPIAVSNAAAGTVSGPVVFPSGGSSLYSTTFTPNAAATGTQISNLTIMQPAGFTATSSTNNPDYLVGVVTLAPPVINVSAVLTGNGLFVGGNASLTQTPPAAVPVTITSSTPSVALVSSSTTAVGTAGYTTGNVTQVPQFYVQGVSVGTSLLSVSAPGYTTGTAMITVDPSGFIFYSANLTFTTTTTSAPTTNILVLPEVLNPGTLTILQQGGSINPGTPTISVPISVTPGSGSTTGGATMTTPLLFPAGSNSAYATFTPGSVAGVANVALVQPTGFTATSSTTGPNYLGGTVTITGPNLALGASNVTTGVGLAVPDSAYLSTAPGSGLTVNVSVGTGALLSMTPTGAGSSSLAFPGVTGTSTPTFYVQGVTANTSPTITVTATGYTNGTATAAVDAAGFVFTGGLPISTTTVSQPSTITVAPVLITPGTLAVAGNGYYGNFCNGCQLISAQTVNLASSTSGIGTLGSSALSFAAGSSGQTTTFTPVGTGSTTISIPAQPTGFTATSSTNGTTYLSGLATVGQPTIATASTSLITGVSLEVPLTFNLSQISTSAVGGVAITVASTNPAMAVVSTSATTAGAASAGYNATTTGTQTVYVQGLTTGTTSLTFTASGYTTTTVTLTVDPSGFAITTPSVTASLSGYTGSNPTPVSVQPAILAAGTLTFVGTAQVTPGQGTLGVTIYTQANASCGGTGIAGEFQSSAGPVQYATLNFNAGDSAQVANFIPQIANCSSEIILNGGSYPAGYNYPSQDYEIPVAVTH